MRTEHFHKRCLRAALAVGMLLTLLMAAPAAAQDGDDASSAEGIYHSGPAAQAEVFAEHLEELTFDLNNLIFPVVGEVTYTDDFGAPRCCGRTHEGNDIMTLEGKGVPVVAVADGVVGWIGATCCYFEIEHADGYSTWFIHLNNDTPGTDDGLGWGIAEGIVTGAEVTAGQLIGWSGDSGNAEGTSPHLHFEIRENGVAINPYPYLQVATVLEEPGAVGWDGYFKDDDGSVHEADIDLMFDLGITLGCNPPTNDEFCPSAKLTRGHIAAFLRRNLDLPATETDYFDDDGASIFEGDINALAEAGIAFGCSETGYCPEAELLREEMAELLVRAFAPLDPDRYANPDGVDYFVDDEDSPFADSINRLKYAGVTIGCNPPDNTMFCSITSLSRAEMASFMARALAASAASE